jgi:Uma2 family endonuclease
MAVQVPLEDVYRMPLDEYHQLVESGALEDARVELIGGLIVAMSAKTPAHEYVLMWLSDWLHTHADRVRYEVRNQSALTIIDSEPEPDLLLVKRQGFRPYHPATAALVIEVCVSSHRRDLREKPSLYAAADVPDYWVVDVDGRRAVHHTDPGPDGYATVREVDVLTAGALPQQNLPLADVLRDLG